MTVSMPESVAAFGKVSVVLVADIADTAAPSLATEINAVTSVNVSCFLYGGAPGTVSTNKGTAPRKLCTTNQFEQRGVSNVTVGDLTYSHSPQAADNDAANEARTALVDGTRWFMVVRSGKDGDSAIVATDKVDIWEVELLPQNRGTTGDGEFDEFAIIQSVIAKAAPVYDSVVAA